MDIPKSEVISVIYELLPGFISAWIFYGLTAHPRKSPFERTVQALIFTALVRALLWPAKSTLLAIGERGFVLSVWSPNAEFAVSILIAILLGFVFTIFANTGVFHEYLPDWVTQRTSFPSEWYSAFKRQKRYIYIYLKDKRRLYGWPTEWPDHPDLGHFVIEQPAWILEDNTRVQMILIHQLVISVTDVEMIEFEKDPDEYNYSHEELEDNAEKLLSLHREEEKSKTEITHQTRLILPPY